MLSEDTEKLLIKLIKEELSICGDTNIDEIIIKCCEELNIDNIDFTIEYIKCLIY